MRNRFKHFTRFKRFMLGALSLALIASPSFAIDANLVLEGSVQGAIEGESTTAGREDTIEVLGVSGSLTTPIGAGGTQSGQGQCRRVTIRKAVDKSSPLLAIAWAQNEVLSEFQLRFYRPSQTGVTQNYFTLNLNNARIVSISQAGGEGDATLVEQVSFLFSAAEYVYLGGITGQVSCNTGA